MEPPSTLNGLLMTRVAKSGLWISFCFHLFFLSSTAFSASLRNVQVVFEYDSFVNGLAGFRLYHADNPSPVCTVTNPAARQLDCQVLLAPGQTYFTMTAFDSTNHESAHSAPFTVTVNTAAKLPGDIDGNGIVDLNDLYLVLEILAGNSPAQAICLEADVNGDGKIGEEEALYILQKISGLRSQ